MTRPAHQLAMHHHARPMTRLETDALLLEVLTRFTPLLLRAFFDRAPAEIGQRPFRINCRKDQP